MTWWDDEHKVDDDKIAHPADCSQWQRIDEKQKNSMMTQGMYGLT